MARLVAEILAEAQANNWPTSSVKANHHLCGNLARDYVNACFTDSGFPSLSPESRLVGPEGRGSVAPGPRPPQPPRGNVEANPNCPQCHGTGWRRPTPFEGPDDVRCGC